MRSVTVSWTLTDLHFAMGALMVPVYQVPELVKVTVNGTAV